VSAGNEENEKRKFNLVHHPGRECVRLHVVDRDQRFVKLPAQVSGVLRSDSEKRRKLQYINMESVTKNIVQELVALGRITPIR